MGPRVAFFATCVADRFFGEGAADAVRLLRRFGAEVIVPGAQTCCGQPAFNAGFHEEARRMARHTLDAFRGADAVVLPSGSCAAYLRGHLASLFDDPALRAAAEDLAGRTWELSRYLVEVLGVGELGSGLAGRRVVLHHGCHALRGLGLREEPAALLRGAGAILVPWEASEECCGFGGLFSIKLPEVSAAMADRKIDTLPEADVLTSADPACLMQLAGRMGVRGRALPVRALPSLLWEGCRGR